MDAELRELTSLKGVSDAKVFVGRLKKAQQNRRLDTIADAATATATPARSRTD